MPKLTIDGQEIEVEAGMTVLQACEQAGVEIPRFCYHERLSVAGNCRMCLVEVSPGPPKPQASCALPVAEGQVIKTQSPMVKKARAGVMEFLLINHPLDCPICDQGGECDLQDQAYAYGANKSRYQEAKRAVSEKYMGPIVKTEMTRCIHCTRCVRFVTEVAGVNAIGLLNRGNHAEISALEQGIDSELSGNLVDLCPVGALTAKPYSFHGRPWELSKVPSIDVTDGLGANIRIDVRGNEVMRILPRLHEDVNEEWISDKARHAVDGLKAKRLDKPWVRAEDGKLKPCRWDEALAQTAAAIQQVKPSEIAVVAGNLTDCETLFAAKSLFSQCGVTDFESRIDGSWQDAEDSSAYRFNSTIAGIDDMDALVVIGCDVKKESAVLNARIRKRWLSGKLKIAQIGPDVKTTWQAKPLGDGPQALVELIEGSSEFAEILAKAERPALILGSGALARKDGHAILKLAKAVAARYQMVKDGWHGFNVLNHAASRVGAMLLGFVPTDGLERGASTPLEALFTKVESGKIKLVYLLGADELPMDRIAKAKLIYQGSHGDAGAHAADIILPGAAYTEKQASYVNIEGRVQQTTRAVFPPGEAKEDWAILRALSEKLSNRLPFDDLEGLRHRLYQSYPQLQRLDQAQAGTWHDVATGVVESAVAMIDNTPFSYPIQDYYLTDVIGRASLTMRACQQEFSSPKAKHGKEFDEGVKVAAHG